MLSFFRKYNRILLVVFGSFLMVVFLLPATGDWGGGYNPGSEVLGTIDGKKITVADQRAADDELRALRFIPDMQVPQDPLQWLMLIEEAKKNGIYASKAQGQELLNAMIAQGMQVNILLRAAGVSPDQFVDALRHFVMFSELQNLIVGAGHASEPRLKHFAVDVRSRASIEFAAVDASVLADAMPAPSEAEIVAQFEKYKSMKPGESEPYGFGYYQPARFKIEYLTVPLKDVAASIEVNEVEAATWYQEHPERYMPTPPPPPAPDKDGKTPPAPEAPKGPLPYMEVRAKVMAEMTERKAKAKQDKILKWINVQIAERTLHLPTTQDGYRTVPADFKGVDLAAVANSVQKEFGVLPSVVRIDNKLLNMDEIAELPGISKAELMISDQPVSLMQYVAMTKELNPPTAGMAAALRLQAQLPSRVLTDFDGNAYIFNLIAVDPAHEPKSLNEPGIREQVVRDIKRAKAFEQLVKANDMLPVVRKEGLEKFAEMYKTKKETSTFSGREALTFFQGKPEAPALPEIGRSETFVDAVFAMARKVEDAGGRDKAPAEMLLQVIPAPKKQKVVVVKLVDYQPIDVNSYAQIKPAMLNVLARTIQSDFAGNAPFTREAVAKRVNWKPAREEKPAKKDEAAVAEKP